MNPIVGTEINREQRQIMGVCVINGEPQRVSHVKVVKLVFIVVSAALEFPIHKCKKCVCVSRVDP